tara:strand:- start:111 stop:347 length:237 start_codon:yes stop_codon:yes gene_type:complete
MSELHSEQREEKEPCPTCDKMTAEQKLNKCAYALGMASGSVYSMLEEANDKNHLTPSLKKLSVFLIEASQEIFYEGKS